MIRIKDKYNCLQSQIGLRGLCEDVEADCYLDDLPGINLANIADMTDGMDIRPEVVLKKNLNLAAKQLPIDLKMLLAKDFAVRGVIDDDSIKLSGADEWIGMEDKFVAITIQGYSNDKFVERCVNGFGILADRDADGKVFYVETDKHPRQECIFNVRKGYNRIPIDVTTDAEWIRIYFDVSNFKIGRREHYQATSNNGCCMRCCEADTSKCSYVQCEYSSDGCNWTYTSDYIGFDLCISCRCSPDLIACYFSKELLMPMLYKTGINFLLDAKSSTNLNCYTRNNERQIQDLLLRWSGGVDMSTNLKFSSEYWKSLKSSVESIKHSIEQLDSKCFKCQSNRLINQMPG